jgi:CheY-like chemotaxis protein
MTLRALSIHSQLAGAEDQGDMKKTELLAQLKDALDRLYDPVRLRDHPLAQILHLTSASMQSRGEILRQLLWDTVDALRPAEGLPPGRAEWAIYNVLKLRYLHAMQPSEVQDELGLSPATYYRRQSEGLDTLVSLLSESIPAETEEQDAASMVCLSGQAREEAVRAARESERQILSIPRFLAEIGYTIDMLAQSRGVRVLIKTALSLPSIYTNPAMLRLIILNLVTEAIEMAETDSLTLSVSTDAENTTWCLAPLQGKAIHGTMESIDGLSVCQGMLQFYGGRLGFGRDGVSRLAMVWTLPIARPRNILVIEDSDQTIELYRRYLAHQNYTVYGASDRTEISARLEDMLPDAILLDVFMPGIDGWTILQTLRLAKETANVPIVVCSVLSQPHVAFALGASDVLAKPFSQRDLLRVLDRLLEGNQAEISQMPPA